ncbi:REP-associated tyrosine transposase [Noviherbaspirillum soli]|uniref:REP-associated tyrosine transposase n=1 Tax=Noviherbaspirillum soli TaxID=1064518 RepID=UPI00188BE10F|nr:transposase [Noviherbaspirillum soli]
MVQYRRNFLSGASYFFTIALLNRTSSLLIDQIAILCNAFQPVQAQRSFPLDAVVVMPDHLHSLWTLPSGEADYPGRWRAIKTRFSCQIPRGEWRSASRARKGERGTWQSQCRERALCDERDKTRHVDYIPFNPVKHGQISHVVQWTSSSFHRFVRQGIYPVDGGGGEAGSGGSGE